MRVTLKDTRLNEHIVDIDDSASIADLKNIVNFPKQPPQVLTLVYNKQPLFDGDTLRSIGYVPDRSIFFLYVTPSASLAASSRRLAASGCGAASSARCGAASSACNFPIWAALTPSQRECFMDGAGNIVANPTEGPGPGI